MSLTTASILAALVIGLNLAATALAADTAALREGVKEICEEHGGTYWDAGGMFGCTIGDLNAEIICLEGSGCVVEETSAARPVTRAAQGQLAGAGVLKAITSRRQYCGTAVRDHRAGRPAERLQTSVCRRFRLPVGGGTVHQ